jgi:hypothetical protein
MRSTNAGTTRTSSGMRSGGGMRGGRR